MTFTRFTEKYFDADVDENTNPAICHYRVIDFDELAHEDMLGVAIYKLGRYEDLEEEIGITFPLLINILKKGIYEEYNKDQFRYIPGENLILNIKDRCFYCNYTEDDRLVFPFKSYRDTWALTKEELILPF